MKRQVPPGHADVAAAVDRAAGEEAAASHVASPAADLGRVPAWAQDGALPASAVGAGLAAGGHRLDEATVAEVGPQLGDGKDGTSRRELLERVRVHTDPVAASSATALGADAYAIGNDIAFAPGRYDPRSDPGRALLAHELSHVAATPGGPQAVLRQTAPVSEEERANRVRAAYAAAVTASNWTEVSTVANAFSDVELITKLTVLTATQKAKLLAAARQNPAIGDGMRIIRVLEGLLGRAPGAIFGTVTRAAVQHAPAAAGGEYSYEMRVRFHPDPTVVNATKIGFVQTSRVVLPGTNTNAEYMAPQKDRRNADQEAIDRIAGRKFGFYGVNNDGTPAGTITFGAAPASPSDAAFFDEPRDALNPASFNFETAIVAMEGPQAGLVYAVIHWGFDVSATGVLTPHTQTVVDTPTAGFATARAAWNAQAAGPAAGRNAPDQQPLPEIR